MPTSIVLMKKGNFNTTTERQVLKLYPEVTADKLVFKNVKGKNVTIKMGDSAFHSNVLVDNIITTLDEMADIAAKFDGNNLVLRNGTREKIEVGQFYFDVMNENTVLDLTDTGIGDYNGKSLIGDFIGFSKLSFTAAGVKQIVKYKVTVKSNLLIESPMDAEAVVRDGYPTNTRILDDQGSVESNLREIQAAILELTSNGVSVTITGEQLEVENISALKDFDITVEKITEEVLDI